MLTHPTQRSEHGRGSAASVHPSLNWRNNASSWRLNRVISPSSLLGMGLPPGCGCVPKGVTHRYELCPSSHCRERFSSPEDGQLNHTPSSIDCCHLTPKFRDLLPGSDSYSMFSWQPMYQSLLAESHTSQLFSSSFWETDRKHSV